MELDNLFQSKKQDLCISFSIHEKGINRKRLKRHGNEEIFKRYLVFVIGLYFLAAGIVLIIRSALGTTPISSINYVLSLNSLYH